MKKKPEYMMIYQCAECGLDSGFTNAIANVRCYYCPDKTHMTLISKQKLTKQVVAERLKTVTDRLFSSLQSAYDSMSEENKNMVSENGNDYEKEMLKALGHAKKMKEFSEDFSKEACMEKEKNLRQL
jgi:DNA-directed RNA polymerase subunit RPC12/RpoP